MPAKPVLSWSKRHSGLDPSSRTGLLDTLKRRPSKLATTAADGKQNGSSTSVAQYDTALASAVSNFHVAVNDMLYSPASINTLSSKSSFVDKPLPSRPRSASVPSLVELPAELPKSTLLQGQGYPLYHDPIRATKSVQALQDESQYPKMQPACEKVATLDIPKPAVPTLTHARSVPHLSSRYSLAKTTRPSKIPVLSTAAQSGFQGLQRNHSLTDTTLQRRPESSLKSLPTITKNDLIERGGRNSDQGLEKRHGYVEAESSQTSPTSAHSKHAHELESTNASQLQTIAILQAQFDNLRASHESHVETLKRSHSVQVASLEHQARLLKERMNEEGLQRRSSGDWLHVPVDEGVAKKPANFESLNLDTSFDEILTGKTHTHTFQINAPEMENLKRKLFASPRLETATQNLHLELSLYARNNTALQKQVDSLTTKLNESNESERKLRETLGLVETKSAEWEEKAKHANKLIDKLTEKIHALKNTTADLEARLEIANAKRLDAEEQFSNLRDKKSPFDFTPAKLRISSNAIRVASGTQISTGTQTSSESADTSEAVVSENPALAASASEIEQLQAQVAEKNAYVIELEAKREELQQEYNKLDQEHKRVAVQSDLQYELLKETRASDKLIEQLRNAVINRESTIMQNEESIHTLTRQLEYHKVLLQAEIRQHTAMKLFVAEEEQPLPELRSLAKGADIDCWIEKLHERLKREKPSSEDEAVVDTPEAKMERLRREIDFYVREIILFKLDIKGYRSDIRKLKEMAANKGGSEESDDTREKASATSPVRSTFAPVTPELDAFLNASSIRDHTDILSRYEEHSVAPSSPGPSHKSWTGEDNEQMFGLEIPKVSWSLKNNSFFTTESGRIDSAFSPSPTPNLISKNSTPSCVLSESLEIGQQRDSLEPAEKRRTTSTAEREAASYRQFIFMSDAPESPPSLPVDIYQLLDNFSSNEQMAETSFGPYDEVEVSILPGSPTISLSETDSVISTASDFLLYSVLSAERKPSNAPTPSVPLQVAVEPLPAPVLVTPAVATHTLGCSITRGAPFDVKLSSSKFDTDETTAPSTLADIPVLQTKTWQEEMHKATKSSSSSPTVFEKEEEQSMSLPIIMSRLRGGSISSIYSADSVSKPSEQQDTEISESNVINMLKALQSCPFSLKPKSSSSSLRSFA
ncbi:hypothetical protein COCMIDRAFT_110429 [Bipolaris oryzae ATCC 44560]|uniref:Uncharacterized protein n=1 Tax=Bipolaris oryzae ATCC 44560 TaxID=930090 RepID=W6YQQ2_COCMI|nr:uncharacterized protein COCMIDRAFT_110429 [Bipolaris oryzae ATCC 44560]EUC39838.1 hypothetical protein COCMIDRAFT_110429 [Bipolaris oryzae ATCC 44560]